MKLVLLTRYGSLGASSRLRMLQFIPSLQEAGINVEVTPFFDNSYLSELYADQRSPTKILRYYISRFRTLFWHQKPNAIWLEKESFPWLPFALEKAIMPAGVPVVSDYDDAVFHRYDQHYSSIVRQVLGNKIDKVMASSRIVTAGNPYLAERALKAGARRIEIIPTVVDINSYSTVSQPPYDRRLRVGWIGTPSTWRDYGTPMVPLLRELATKHNARIRIVGAGREAPQDDRFESLQWSEDTEGVSIQGMNVGLMPLDDSLWSRGKCGYKLIQYMACGVPVVASPVGVNAEIVEHGVNGFLARTDAEWREAIDTLLSNEELRKRMGAAGRRLVEERYSLQVYGPRLASLFRSEFCPHR